ncbi:MAG: CHASE2 domain-containing protein, partial [Pseudomonadota bacterium]
MRRKLIYIAAFVLVVALHQFGALNFLEARLSDMRFSLVKRAPTTDLIVVGIDPPSLAELDRWPWPRSHHADVLTKLIDAGAKQVAFDVDFSAATTPTNDRLFEEATIRAGDRLVLPVFKQHVPSDAGLMSMISRPREQFISAARLASINVVPDRDGAVRAMPVPIFSQGVLTPSLAEVLAGKQVPPSTSYLVDFGIELSQIPRVSYADILRDRVDMSQFKGKTVLIGATAAQLHDQIPVARHVSISGVKLHALAYQSLVQDRVLTAHGVPITLTIGALLILLFAERMHQWSWQRCLLTMTLGPTFLFAVSILTQINLAWSIEVAPSIFLLAVIMTAATLDQLYSQRLAILFQTRRAAQTRSIMDSVVENSFDGIATFDPEGCLKSANAAFLSMYGATFEAVQSWELSCFVELPETDKAAESPDHPLGQNEGFGIRFDGDRFPIDFTISRAISEDYSGIVVTVRDTT